MWFHFFIGNHDSIGRRTLGDMIDWFRAGLEEAGHSVTLGMDVAPDAVNLVWEHSMPGQGSWLRDSGICYGLVATELPDGGGFNWRRDPPWPDRWANFGEVASHAAFIWSMIESATEVYSAYAPTAYMELGFSERLLPQGARAEPVHDFGFNGLLTPHREAVLETLGRHCSVAVQTNIVEKDAMLQFMDSCRIGLCFKQSTQWPIPSPTRLGRLLHAKRGIAAEPVAVHTRQGEFAAFASEGEDFAAFCLKRLESDWREGAEWAFEAYRDRMPMCEIVERVVERTIVGNPRLTRLRDARPTEERLDSSSIHVADSR